MINQLEGCFSLEPQEDIEPQEVIKDEDSEQILAIIVKGAVSFPVSFEAIRNSRKWGKEKSQERSVSALRFIRTGASRKAVWVSEKDGYAMPAAGV